MAEAWSSRKFIFVVALIIFASASFVWCVSYYSIVALNLQDKIHNDWRSIPFVLAIIGGPLLAGKFIDIWCNYLERN